jgi:hypothetical protein
MSSMFHVNNHVNVPLEVEENKQVQRYAVLHLGPVFSKQQPTNLQPHHTPIMNIKDQDSH